MLAAGEAALGLEHPQTLVSINNLASVYSATGRYSEAEPFYDRVLEARERVLGPPDPDTLNSVTNFGFLYEATGRYDEAGHRQLENTGGCWAGVFQILAMRDQSGHIGIGHAESLRCVR